MICRDAFQKIKQTNLLLYQKRIVITFSILWFGFTSYAQEQTLNDKTVEESTYNFYKYKEWDKLIDRGNKALKQDIDYFYLRLRLGIAYFQTGNYYMASDHLEIALKYNSSDQTALEYLYLAYILTNRSVEANYIRSSFNAELLKRYPKKLVDNININTGPIFSDNISRNKKESLLNGRNLSGQQDLNDSKYFNQIGFRFNPLKNLSLGLRYSNLRTKKLKQIEASELVSIGTTTIEFPGFSYPDTLYGLNYQLHEDNYTINQNGIFINIVYSPAKGWTIIPAVHLLFIDFRTIFIESSVEEYFAQSYDTIPSLKSVYSIEKRKVSLSDYILSLSLNKTIKNMDLDGTFSYSNLNYQEQYQTGLSFTWYPKGNLNLYFRSGIISHWQNSEHNIIYDQSAGIKIADPLWLEGRFVIGDQINYNENNAFVVFNSGDVTKFRVGSGIIVLLKPEFELNLGYQFVRNNGFRFVETIQNEIISETLIYTNHILITGLKWKF